MIRSGMFMIAVAVSLLLSACSMPETKTYSLSVSLAGSPAGRQAIGPLVVSVQSPRHLSQPYIVRRPSPYEMDISRYARWEASPAEMVKDAMRTSLRRLSLYSEIRTGDFPAPDASNLEIDLRHFERSDSSSGSFAEVAFEAALITGDGREVLRRTVEKKVRVEQTGQVGLASAMSTALEAAIEELRAEVLKAEIPTRDPAR